MIQFEKRNIKEIIEKLPELKSDFDFDKNIKFQILKDYGTGSSLICEIIGTDFKWGHE